MKQQKNPGSPLPCKHLGSASHTQKKTTGSLRTCHRQEEPKKDGEITTGGVYTRSLLKKGRGQVQTKPRDWTNCPMTLAIMHQYCVVLTTMRYNTDGIHERKVCGDKEKDSAVKTEFPTFFFILKSKYQSIDPEKFWRYSTSSVSNSQPILNFYEK